MQGAFHLDVSENSGTPKSSIFIGFSIINHPFWGTTIFGNTHLVSEFLGSGFSGSHQDIVFPASLGALGSNTVPWASGSEFGFRPYVQGDSRSFSPGGVNCTFLGVFAECRG